ncbi:MAG: nicotinate (nicotinamide) nucleotide adenylyltransferase [Oscillospiraceae bacterium]|nr:nicotinate (nicotinamide) nucleotide adenylyltransferase [Oscillospiraceae bacterium]
MRVGIYGGTFNPPHTGHENSALTAIGQLSLDFLVIIPVGVPPHKPMPKGSPSADTRLLMAKNAFSNLKNTIVSSIESRNPEPSYTVETVDVIQHIYPDAELFLLMGTDMYLSLETWRGFKSLLKAITPTVFSRDEDDTQKIAEYSLYLEETYGVRTKTVLNTVIPVSSSQLRELLPERGGIGYINDTNYSYIISCRLYGAKPDWSWLREHAYSMLTPTRVPHVAACEDAAISLAKRWGVDLGDAREAAILHDITKKFDLDAHLKALEDNGIEIVSLKDDDEKLLHAKSGAVLAQSMFGTSPEVTDAIRWHTTGKAGMSMLAKVLYLADYIESTRDFPGVGTLRQLAYENINEAMVLGLEMTVSDVTARGITPDEATLDAIKDLK